MSIFNFDGLLNDIEGDEFETSPVDLETFMGPEYLNEEGITLGPYQKEMIERMTQVYNRDSLVRLYGETEANKIMKKTVQEIVCMLGKGSGKDYCAEIACCYLVYKLQCLKNPSKYFGVPPGDSIDIINVALNADQANNIFFGGMRRIVERSPYFQALGVVPQSRMIKFPKNITLYSGHSEAKAFEGYNTIMVILDEIAGFEHWGEELEDGISPAQATYDMYKDSVISRFPNNGKLVLLSFPRQKGDFIETRYQEVVGEVESIPYSHEFVINKELSPDEPGNSFTIEWTIDHIISYKQDNVWALRRPSWEVNPIRDIEYYKQRFFENVNAALGKFAAEPQISVSGFFDDHEKIDRFSNSNNGWDAENNKFQDWFKPSEDEDVTYFVHVDLSRKHDRCAVAMAHVTGWQRDGMMGADEYVPKVRVDLLRYWTPTRERQIDFAEVREFIMSINRRGFRIKKVTFDQWQSDEMIKYFNRVGIESEVLSVGLPHYMDLKLIVSEERGRAPFNEILRKELKQLQITKNGKNVDHPRTSTGSKDLADACCGAIYNAALLTPKKIGFDFKVLSEDDFDDGPVIPSNDFFFAPKAPEGTRVPADIARYIDIELL